MLAREVDIRSEEDVLEYFPYRYVDRSRIYEIRELTADMSYVQVVGRFVTKEIVGVGTKKRMTARFVDGTGEMDIVWFKGLNYIVNQINTTDVYLLFGKPTVFGGRLNMAHPDLERNPDKAQFVGKLMPLYNT